MRVQWNYTLETDGQSKEERNGDSKFTLKGEVLPNTTEVYAAVRERTNGKIDALQIESQGGTIILLGNTSTYYFKQLAQQAAMEIAYSCSIQNQIVVK